MAITWTKFTGAARSTQGVTTATTEAAPSASADGLALLSVDAVCVSVAAPNGQNFDGTGKWLFYRWSDYLQAWRYLEGWDYDMAPEAGKPSATILLLPVTHKSGRLAAIPSGVGTSGGSVLTITMEASFGAGGDNQ